MKTAWHQRLIVRIGAAIVCIEIVALAVMGWWFTRAYGQQLEHERTTRLQTPGNMMALGLMTYDAISDSNILRSVLVDDVEEALVFGANGVVFNSLRPERLDESAFDFIEFSPTDLERLPDEGITRHAQDGNGLVSYHLQPIRTAGGQATFAHVYVRVHATAGLTQQRVIAQRFALGSVVTVVVTTLALLAVFSAQVGRRLGGLLEVIGTVKAGSMDARVPEAHDPTELGRLGEGLNSMLDAITERDAQVGRISRMQRVILDNAAYAIIATEVDGTITLFNRAAELLLGYTAAELVGRCTPARFHYWPEIEARAEMYSRQFGVKIEPGFEVFVCRTKRRLPNEDEWTYVHKNGTHLTVLLGITALRNADGEITGYIGNAHDISVRRKAEQELRHSREQLEGAQRLARLGSWEFDLIKERLYWSPQLFEIYAWKHAEPPAKLADFLELIHPDDRERVVQGNEAALKSDEQVTLEFYTNPARGASRCCSARVYVIRNTSQQPVALAGTVQDITELKQAEKALRESDERARMTISALAEGVVVLDREGRTIVSNPNAENILGLMHDQLVGKAERDPGWRTIREDGTLFPRDEHPVARTLQTGQALEGVIMGVQKPGGTCTWISINTAPLVRENETSPYAAVASFFDITERRAQERAQRERARMAEMDAALSRRLSGSGDVPETLQGCAQEIVTHLQVPVAQIWLLDEDHSMLQQIACAGGDPQLAGAPTRIAVGSSIVGKVARDHLSIRTDQLADDPAIGEGGRSGRDEVKWFAGFPMIAGGRLLGVLGLSGQREISDETFRAMELVGSRIGLGILRKENDAEVQRLNRELEQRVGERTAELERRIGEVETLNRSMINLLEDLQQSRVDAESVAQELTAANLRLRTANSELEAFSYSVSHDLRAPLRNIVGFVDLLRGRLGAAEDATIGRYLGVIQSESRRMGVLIDELLKFSRLSRQAVQTEHYSMNELVRQVVHDLTVHVDRPLKWKIGNLEDVPSDRSLIRQVWENLLGNAIKYTRGRTPALIEVGTAPPEADGTAQVYFVRDNGAGFDMNYAGKLFGVFQRLHSNTEFEGTGIGLAIVHRIVTRHGGTARGEGNPGQGATFYFSLPKRRA